MSGKFLIKNQAGQLHGEVKSQVVTISGSPTPIPEDQLKDRKDMLVYNGNVQTVYLGGDSVTTSNGIPLAEGSSFGFQAGRANLYGVVTSGTVDVRLLEIA